jgi:hypothetical protein
MANHRMKPRISVITLGVNDLETSLAFYRDGLERCTELLSYKLFLYRGELR